LLTTDLKRGSSRPPFDPGSAPTLPMSKNLENLMKNQNIQILRRFTNRSSNCIFHPTSQRQLHEDLARTTGTVTGQQLAYRYGGFSGRSSQCGFMPPGQKTA
jgi:hypothetical protein